jgi:CheY-like chemotaxis protein
MKILIVDDIKENLYLLGTCFNYDKALEEISKNKGILYDHEVVDVCLKLFRKKEFKF